MHLLDPDIGRARALVADGNAASRATLVATLREAGVPEVDQAPRLADARRLLEARPYDIVVIEFHFAAGVGTGQDLIADLRLAQLLPLRTTVVMVSAESAYAQVAEAAEVALDAYLIKPHTALQLTERLARARRVKRELAPILAAVEAGRHEEAVTLCQAAFDARARNWVHAARIAAELLIKLGRPHAAMAMLEAVLAAGALPWARMGIARAQYQCGNLTQARRTLESLLSDQPGYVDAYDVMARVLLDMGDPAGALGALRRASQLTPGSVARLQKHGALAFYFGAADEAAEILERACAQGLNSRTYDLQGLVLLATLQHDRRDKRKLALSHATLQRLQREHVGSARIGRLAGTVEVLHLLAQRQVPRAVQAVQQMLGDIGAADFDFEAACNLLLLLDRLCRNEVRLDELEAPMRQLAQRFAVSRAACETLCAASGDAARSDILRVEYAGICAVAQEAVERAVGGQRREAVLALLEHAEATLNAKLLDMADHMLSRHIAAIDDAGALAERVAALRAGHHKYGARLHLTRPSQPA